MLRSRGECAFLGCPHGERTDQEVLFFWRHRWRCSWEVDHVCMVFVGNWFHLKPPKLVPVISRMFFQGTHLAWEESATEGCWSV